MLECVKSRGYVVLLWPFHYPCGERINFAAKPHHCMGTCRNTDILLERRFDIPPSVNITVWVWSPERRSCPLVSADSKATAWEPHHQVTITMIRLRRRLSENGSSNHGCDVG